MKSHLWNNHSKITLIILIEKSFVISCSKNEKYQKDSSFVIERSKIILLNIINISNLYNYIIISI